MLFDAHVTEPVVFAGIELLDQMVPDVPLPNDRSAHSADQVGLHLDDMIGI